MKHPVQYKRPLGEGKSAAPGREGIPSNPQSTNMADPGLEEQDSPHGPLTVHATATGETFLRQGEDGSQR